MVDGEENDREVKIWLASSHLDITEQTDPNSAETNQSTFCISLRDKIRDKSSFISPLLVLMTRKYTIQEQKKKKIAWFL